MKNCRNKLVKEKSKCKNQIQNKGRENKMDIGSIATICTTVIVTVAGVATIIANIRYMKSENSKVLRRQEQILLKIEEGQEKGFKALSEDSKVIAQILERIESNTRT